VAGLPSGIGGQTKTPRELGPRGVCLDLSQSLPDSVCARTAEKNDMHLNGSQWICSTARATGREPFRGPSNPWIQRDGAIRSNGIAPSGHDDANLLHRRKLADHGVRVRTRARRSAKRKFVPSGARRLMEVSRHSAGHSSVASCRAAPRAWCRRIRSAFSRLPIYGQCTGRFVEQTSNSPAVVTGEKRPQRGRFRQMPVACKSSELGPIPPAQDHDAGCHQRCQLGCPN